MRELNRYEIQEINGGTDAIGYAGDALTIGGGILAGMAATTTAPIWVVAAAVTGSYYLGKAVGDLLFN